MSKHTLTILALPDLHGIIPQKVLQDAPQFDIIIMPGDICDDNMQKSGKGVKKVMKKSLDRGKEILQELSNLNKPIYLVPGNWEPTKYSDGIKRENTNFFEEMIQEFPLVHNCEYRTVHINETKTSKVSIIGAGSTSAPEIISKTQLQTRLEYENEEEEIKELRERYLYQKQKFEIVSQEFEKLNQNDFKIFLSHNSPYNTPLDVIKNPFNPLHNQHYGSVLARTIIEKYQPQLVISGHIHEGVGICKINNTICLNTGFGDGIYHLITIDIAQNKVLKIKKYGKNAL
ncbi:MAG: metallophosphoesterase [Candidatus Nanoarchaeia archaeon]